MNEIQKIESLILADFKSNLNNLKTEEILDSFFIIGKLLNRFLVIEMQNILGKLAVYIEKDYIFCSRLSNFEHD